jgi:hypothetical protein
LLSRRFFIRSADEVGEQVISGDSDQSATTVGINDPYRLAHTPSVSFELSGVNDGPGST